MGKDATKGTETEGVAITLNKGTLFKIIHNTFPNVYSELPPSTSALGHKANCIDLENITTHPSAQSSDAVYYSVVF